MPLLGIDLGGLFAGLSSWSWAVLGIGLVIFVHEAGHFLVAKRCGVRCDIFSLGFGPRLFGFKHGDTDYRVSLVPIGGYVKMAGDNPGESLDGDDTELPSKSVGQRFAIFSAGVVMNLLFALVTLPVVLAIGVKFHSTVIGSVEPGGGAWKAGLQAGDEIVSVEGEPVYDFNDVVAQIALGDPKGVEVAVRRGGVVTEEFVVPEMDTVLGRYDAGLRPSLDDTVQIESGGPADQAGIPDGVRLTRFNGEPIESFADYNLLRSENKDPLVRIAYVDDDGREQEVEVNPKPGDPSFLIGISPYFNQVKGLRGAALSHSNFLVPGDELRRMVIQDPSAPEASPLVFPIRDPEELQTAFQAASELPAGKDCMLELDRPGSAGTLRVPLPMPLDPSLADDIALAQDPQSLRIKLLEGYPAESAGLPEDCEVLKINDQRVADWFELRELIGSSKDEAVNVLVVDNGLQKTFTVTPRKDVRLAEFGILPVAAMVERRYGMLEATTVGFGKAVYMIKNVYLTLKKMFVRDVSPKNLSGILTIAVVSKSLAESGIPSLFFFLAILSLNLAFINVLPIPILDGGHLLFLLIEKIKGSPVSERVMGYSQLVGLVMVLALLLYVTYNDLLRVLMS